MTLFDDAERRIADAISRLIYANPFLPDRAAAERDALQQEFEEPVSEWEVDRAGVAETRNLNRLRFRADALLDAARARLVDGATPADAERALYDDLMLFCVYHEFRARLIEYVRGPAAAAGPDFYDEFEGRFQHFAGAGGGSQLEPPAHLFACFFQIVRAFEAIYQWLVGVSAPARRFRAAVWQSIFTHDMRRYRRGLYERMADITTLITGPSGSGKELAARAVGMSRYIPYDRKARRFTEQFSLTFFALNLSALSPTLIESELFGHRRGSFTGAEADRAGWLEQCPALGTVFLDEIGDLDPAIQVKLLRVLQSRTFQRIGEVKERKFAGKIVAATNRDLADEMHSTRFRADFYYRLCSDILDVPALHERLRDCPEELELLLSTIAQRHLGADAESLARETQRFIERNLGQSYAWPGNIRELEQCLRNVMVRGAYHPPQRASRSAWQALGAAVQTGGLTADELLREYCTLTYASCGSFEETGRRLDLDRRTVRSKVDTARVAELREGGGGTIGAAPARTTD